MSSVGFLKYVPWTIANNGTASKYVDLGAEGAVIVGISIHGTWTAGKVFLTTFTPGSDTLIGQNTEVPGYQGQATGGGPASANATFDTVKDNTGTIVYFGNGTDTSAQFLAIPDYQTISAFRYVKVNSTVTQGQAVTGYLIVRSL